MFLGCDIKRPTTRRHPPPPKAGEGNQPRARGKEARRNRTGDTPVRNSDSSGIAEAVKSSIQPSSAAGVPADAIGDSP